MALHDVGVENITLASSNLTLEDLWSKYAVLAAEVHKNKEAATALKERFDPLVENIDLFFLVVMGILISMMQIGFGILESGSVNSKNATNVLFKNMMDSLLCGCVFWLVGYTLAFGEGSSFAGIYYYQGGKDMFVRNQYSNFFFQLSYASTPSTITSGAVVDRISFIAYIFYSSFFSGVVYPIVVHWVWTPEGWLTLLGFKDFCGSGVVHLTGGTCAIVAAVILGARIGRFPGKGEEWTREQELRFSHHNAPLAGLGIMIIFTGFFAFNGGSQLHLSKPGDGEMVGKLAVNTWLASSGAGFGTLAIFRTGIIDGNKRWSVLNAMNAGLSGMAAICAHVDAMDMWAAFVNGLCVSVTYSALVYIVPKLKIDDPINVIAVHFGGGLWGATFASLLRSDSLVGGYPQFAGRQLGLQIAGALAIMAWSGACSLVLFAGLRFLGLLRVSPEDELLGADATKHKEIAYQGLPCECSYKKTDGDRTLPIPVPLMDALVSQLQSQAGKYGADNLNFEMNELRTRPHYASIQL